MHRVYNKMLITSEDLQARKPLSVINIYKPWHTGNIKKNQNGKAGINCLHVSVKVPEIVRCGKNSFGKGLSKLRDFWNKRSGEIIISWLLDLTCRPVNINCSCRGIIAVNSSEQRPWKYLWKNHKSPFRRCARVRNLFIWWDSIIKRSWFFFLSNPMLLKYGGRPNADNLFTSAWHLVKRFWGVHCSDLELAVIVAGFIPRTSVTSERRTSVDLRLWNPYC